MPQTPPQTPTSAHPRIGDYAIIGDCESAALISRHGSLDWLCWPRFDSPAIFAGLLDPYRGGSFRVAPRGKFSASRRYLPGTNVLETRFESDHGVVTLTDFMSVVDNAYRDQHLIPEHAIVRLLRCERGSVTMDVHFAPRPGFGRRVTKIVDRGALGVRVSSGHGMLALHSALSWQIEHEAATANVSMNAGDELPLILTYADASPEAMPLLNQAAASLARTVAWWESWSAALKYDGPYREAVLRSVLTLKLLAFPASGAIVAAPTTSLPEQLGGKLNWDYRYCWLRDASFIVDALTGTGFTAEAEAFTNWMIHATRRTRPKLMVAYDVFGNHLPRERALSWLAGYHCASPVHVGNGARSQSQLDTYGEVVSGVAKLLKHKRQPADREISKALVELGHYVCEHWSEPDSGIWEERKHPIVHTHSRLMCWLALQELIDLHERSLIEQMPIDLFKRVRATIRQALESDAWDEAASTYSSQPGKLKLDATLLRMAIHGFDKASSERMQQTHARVCESLGAGGPLLYRNLPDDRKPTQGAFGICGFWRVEFLAMGGGTLAKAEAEFVALLATANDLGLFSEETDPPSGDLLGNFPQGISHVGMITAAMAIEKRRREEAGGA